MVVHRGDHDAVARPHVRPAVGARHQVDRLGGPAREHDAFGRPRVHERRDLCARRLVRLGGADREVVRAAVDVGVGRAVVLRDGVEHGLRLLRRRGVVQIHQAAPVLRLPEQREIGADARDVQHQACPSPSRSRTRRSICARTSGCRMRPRISAPNP